MFSYLLLCLFMLLSLFVYTVHGLLTAGLAAASGTGAGEHPRLRLGRVASKDLPGQGL